MPNEFKVKNGLIVDQGGANITGSSAISGSLDIAGSVTATNFTGSLFGTASWAANFKETDPVFSSKSASLATTGSNSFFGDQYITGSLNLSSSGIHYISGLVTASSTIHVNVTQPVLALDTRGRILYSNFFSTTASLPDPNLYHGMFTHVHNEGSAYYSHGSNGWVRLWDRFNSPNLISGSQVPANIVGQAIAPLSVSASSFVSASEFFGSGSGIVGVISSSYSVTASNGLLFNSTSSERFATTGSNTFIGNQIVTGSLYTSGSNRLVGPTELTGSLGISGSQIIKGYVQFMPVTTNIDTSITASYIYVSGSTNDLYFSQNGDGYNNVTRLRWLEGNLYTGLLHGGLITAATGSTIYQVSSGSGIIVNINASLTANPYPTIKYVNWGNLTASIAPLTASYQQAFVSIDSNGSIYQQGIPYASEQFDTSINIGVVLFQNGSTINGVKTQPSTAYGFEQQQNIFNRAFGPLKLSGYTLAPSGSSTRSLIVAGGTAYSPGSNYSVDPNNPSYTTDSGTNVSKIFRYRQSGSTWVYDTNAGAGYTTIDPTQYSNNGVLTAVPGGGSNREFSIQRVFYFPNSVAKAIVVYYGNATYASLTDATSNISFEPFVEAPNTAANAIYLGAIIVRNNADFTVTDSYAIQTAGLFRSVGGSGGGGSVVTQTLSGLSDVNISGPTNGQPLVYDSTAAKWENKSTLTATLIGNASTATTASYALIAKSIEGIITSASYALTASYVLNAISASYSATASYVLNSISSSYAATASFVATASNAISSSYAVTASYVATLNKKVRTTIPITAVQGQTTLITNIPALVDEVGTELRIRENLLNAVSCSMSARVEQATGGAIGHLKIQYSTDESTWNDLNANKVDLGTVGTQLTTEEAIPSGAKTTGTYIRLVTISGDGTAASNARFGNVTLNIIYDI